MIYWLGQLYTEVTGGDIIHAERMTFLMIFTLFIMQSLDQAL